jgi:hypothetical protein
LRNCQLQGQSDASSCIFAGAGRALVFASGPGAGVKDLIAFLKGDVASWAVCADSCAMASSPGANLGLAKTGPSCILNA